MKDSKKSKKRVVWVVKKRNMIEKVFSSREKALVYRDGQSDFLYVFIYPFPVE